MAKIGHDYAMVLTIAAQAQNVVMGLNSELVIPDVKIFCTDSWKPSELRYASGIIYRYLIDILEV